LNPQFNQRGFLNLHFLIFLGIILLFILFAAYFFYGLLPSVAGAASQKIQIIKGEGLREISADLRNRSLIKSVSVFKIYSLLSGNAQRFQPGVYELSSAMSVPQIVQTLVAGGKNEVMVTIVEGWTLKDIDGILASAGVVPKGAIVDFPPRKLALVYPFLSEVQSLEGFLFPDTYRFEMNSSPDNVMERLLDNFKSKAWPLLSDSKDWYDRLILASFLEREVPDFDDRQIVAGILLKRLGAKIPLQVDATISYAKCDYGVRTCERIAVSKEDLGISSPYNTYQRLGFTPTPISNPGQSAIKAAVSPKSSNWLYYLSAKETKDTIFARTLEEHNRNKVKYL